ncbi:MAG: topoisomerase protein [Candidatus Nomurabacteria bacterium GW2011_GWE1_32_28]|uniref:DNA topoisomerase 1 n=1 Tax=Candidatus Nomurabacteria bacterium GW2011_GWF1_31_48 TaxID=1618767 RepID=A0A0F9YGK2_9BACT|nr:MAG: topoisomerase protein [Candidatus Nomurabacteria bacterium GW2011_GWF2_30_133]KKP28981.1 MAG: topoisomerase protein [Candidatus Nomurabacteria bacterium GW2011_GWE2_31_40]KKP30719.1 MAG: topoisomerase protein [Candidatus Nomurabacteria bacterium GW2011_GWF1_31_48]KKP35237.1 MAG: topoisomerase protein [Candidatus Nomurabacteria bacterium GW2011_GWE1_32_28]HAS80544.1 type I DNA topoisomerase [Candidatus Nomurabacteria bacterium]
MKLLIVESPSKAKTIEKYLEGAYTVRASIGHIRDLPKSNKIAIDIDAGFIPHYEISRGKEKVVHELQSLGEKATEIILATDPDREGEAIAWHIEELLKKDKKIKASTKRVAFYEITKEAVIEALKNPRDIDTNLRKAQEARRVLDRLVGYDLSGLIWKKVRYGLSAGRVQSPALRIIMEREREIRAFIPEQYWKLLGLFETEKKVKLTFTCSKEPRDQELVENILREGKSKDWQVKEIKESEQKRVPRAPFTTSTLQQTASSRLSYSPSRTMQLAQKLYEAGHITYMRTDSTNLSVTAQAQIISLVEKKYGKEYAQSRIYKTKSKNAQEAHEAIRPTHIENLGAGTDEQQKLYKLIWERTISSQMTDAKLLKTKISANISSAPDFEFPDFTATGSRILFRGWLEVDRDSTGEDIELPEVKNGEKLKLLNLIKEEKFTEPPNRYSEAGLIKELEARDIGRPSTYASIMKTLEDRTYVKKENKTLFPTDVGEVVSDFLETHFANYISDTFTAEMEDQLDEISRGEREYEKTLKDFYGPFSKEIKTKEKLEKATNLGDAPKNIKCPKCKEKMIIKLSRNGKFYSCEKYPDCDGALRLDGTEIEGPKETGEICPDCGEKKGKSGGGKLIIKERRDGTGTFISCSRYPKCKFIKKDEAEEAKKRTGVICPLCKKGDISERRGRFGIFYSCSNYPDCKYAIKAKPTGNICKECNSLMMEGTKTIPERCSNKSCKNHNPHKLLNIK